MSLHEGWYSFIKGSATKINPTSGELSFIEKSIYAIDTWEVVIRDAESRDSLYIPDFLLYAITEYLKKGI